MKQKTSTINSTLISPERESYYRARQDTIQGRASPG